MLILCFSTFIPCFLHNNSRYLIITKLISDELGGLKLFLCLLGHFQFLDKRDND